MWYVEYNIFYIKKTIVILKDLMLDKETYI